MRGWRTEKQKPGFTVLELLVSMAVLALVLVLLVNAFGAVVRIWQGGKARADNFTKARVILGTLDRDLQSAVLRRDLGAFVDANGNEALAFYSLVNGSSGNRKVSLVNYSLTNSSNSSVLRRLDYGLDYSTGAPTLQVTNALPDLSKVQLQDVADGILRFEWQFRTTDGSLRESYEYDSEKPNAASNTRSMIVSMLVLDDAAFRLAKQSGTFDALMAKFAANPSPNQTHAELWGANLLNPGFLNGLPDPVRKGVRVYQRQFILKN